jgi:hypothetical protein
MPINKNPLYTVTGRYESFHRLSLMGVSQMVGGIYSFLSKIDFLLLKTKQAFVDLQVRDHILYPVNGGCMRRT